MTGFSLEEYLCFINCLKDSNVLSLLTEIYPQVRDIGGYLGISHAYPWYCPVPGKFNGESYPTGITSSLLSTLPDNIPQSLCYCIDMYHWLILSRIINNTPDRLPRDKHLHQTTGETLPLFIPCLPNIILFKHI